MIWVLLAIVVFIALWPFVREMRKPEMTDRWREDAPGSFVTLSQGVTHYDWIGPVRGPVAVCVHGLTTPSFVWGGLAQGLAAMGFRVLVYDLYGRGYSDRPKGKQDKAFFVAQLEELLAHQEVEADFTLFGYSMGGSIATAFAAKHPARVRQLVLIASAGLQIVETRNHKIVKDMGWLGTWLMYLVFPATHRRSAEKERGLPSSVPGIVDLQINELRFRGFVPAVLASIRGILSADMRNDHGSIHDARVPVLAVWGRQDTVIPITALARLTEVSPNTKQEVIETTGHGLAYTHTADVLAAMRETLRDGLN